MKTMKKLAAMLLALLLVLTMTTAFAENKATELGSITINGVGATSTYEIYRLLDLESYDTVSKAYSYKVNSDWADFFATDEAKAYFAVDSQGYATWIAGEVEDSVVATFAKGALSYAQLKGIAPVKTTENEGDFVITGTTGVFSDLVLGYYLVDSSVGALCGLTTTNPNASINAKNGIPTLDKQVQEDSTEGYGDSNSADIGQIVNFRNTISVHAGAENYVMHDKMSAGLTFKEVGKVDLISDGTTTTLVKGTDYTINTATDGCTFEVVFTKELCDTLETNDKLIVYYSAMLNRHAIIAGEGNSNEAWLEYGEENLTTHDKTNTFTFSFDIVKTDSQNTLIDGAGFKIYDALTGGNEIAVVPLLAADDKTPVLDDKGNPMYRRARANEPGVEIMVKGGIVTIVGFDNGTYYLEETTTPAGYNQLSARQKFIIADGNLDATFNGDTFSTGSGVHVVNKSGTMLPETGGIGTTLFYAIGGMLAAAAVVLLVTKKRMSNMA